MVRTCTHHLLVISNTPCIPYYPQLSFCTLSTHTHIVHVICILSAHVHVICLSSLMLLVYPIIQNWVSVHCLHTHILLMWSVYYLQTYGWHWHCLLGRNISRTTANNVHIIRICPDNVWMTCTYADNMWTMSRCDMQRKPSTQIMSQIIYMILKWNNSIFFWQIRFNNQFLSE